jgi:hypothetical protein
MHKSEEMSSGTWERAADPSSGLARGSCMSQFSDLHFLRMYEVDYYGNNVLPTHPPPPNKKYCYLIPLYGITRK